MAKEYEKQKLLEWYHQYYDDIYRFILMMIGDNERAKDLTHDTFIRAYKNMNDFKRETSDKNWLYYIARNITIDDIRKRKPLLFIVDSFSSISSDEKVPEIIALLGEREKELYCAIKKLKRTYREVIILRKIKELSIQETAEVLDWSEAKVRTTLHRALAALRAQMVKGGFTYETI